LKLDDLRSILLSERETGRLTAVAPDIFEKGHAELAAITGKVYAFEDPFSDDARALIDETLAIRETLEDLFSIRSRKILALTVMHAEGNYYDREEVKRMIPAEREMFEQITVGIEQCKGILLHNAPGTLYTARPEALAAAPAGGISDEDDGGGSGLPESGEPEPVLAPVNPLAHPSVLVQVLENMDSFMGVDGRIYTLAKGDIVTLPERNAAVLSERNIVLNINLCK
jgi:DNA replication factor GINS